MCPFCLATAAIIASSATGTGGLAAVVVSKFRKETITNQVSRANGTKEERNGYDPDRSATPESGLARTMD